MSRAEGVGLALLAGAALSLRVWGLEQGYPEFYGHVDEIGVAASVWNFFRAATLEPTEFTYPAFYSYLVAAALWLSGWLADLPRLDTYRESLVLLSYVDPARAALAGRLLSALLSALAVLLTYWLGARACGRSAAWVGALFMAVSRVPVERAHAALPDSTMAFLALLCFCFSWRICEAGRWRHYALAGMAAGWLVACKYNGAFAALSIPAAHLLRGGGWRRALLSPRLWGAVGLALLCLFLGSPYLLLEPGKYLSLMRYQVSSLNFSTGQTSPWWWIPRLLVQVEGAVGMLMVAGVFWALYRRERLDLLFLAAWVPSFLYIGSWTRESLHYLVHFYPLLALGGARLLVAGLSRFRLPGWGVAALALLCALPGLGPLVEQNRLLSRPDTRASAAAWIEAHIPGGAKLAMTWLPYCPRLALAEARQGIAAHYEQDAQARAFLQRQWAGRPAYDLVNLEVWLRQPVVPESYRERVDLKDPETRRVFSRGWRSPGQLRQMGVEYIVLPEAAYARYLGPVPELEPGSAAHFHFHKNRAYFAYLSDARNPEIEKAISFSAGTEMRGDPIHIFRLR